MTTNRDFDRVARAWLDLMPVEVPDRVIDDVLQAVETAPQLRRPRLAGPTRSTHMTRFLLIAATAVLGVALLGGAFLVAGGHVGPTPTHAPAPSTAIATPAAAPSASATAAYAVPPELRYSWVGAPRDIPGRGSSTRTNLRFGISGVCVAGDQYSPSCDVVSSLLNVVDNRTLRLTTPLLAGADCRGGDAGTYPWSLSPGGTVLTIGAGTDACATRAVAVAGTWYRIGCKDAAAGCLGNLEAGTRPTQYINPRLPAGQPWDPAFGAMTYTVPDGWANSIDYPLSLVLMPASNYALEPTQGSAAGVYHRVEVFGDPAAAVQDASCSGTPDPSITRTAAGLAAWVAGLPGVVASRSQPVTIDGHPGRSIDLTLAPTGAHTCTGDPGPSVQLFTTFRRDTGNNHDFGIGAGEQIRVILLDLDKDHVAAIFIDDGSSDHVADPARFQALVDAAMPIVESMHFQ